MQCSQYFKSHRSMARECFKRCKSLHHPRKTCNRDGKGRILPCHESFMHKGFVAWKEWPLFKYDRSILTGGVKLLPSIKRYEVFCQIFHKKILQSCPSWIGSTTLLFTNNKNIKVPIILNRSVVDPFGRFWMYFKTSQTFLGFCDGNVFQKKSDVSWLLWGFDGGVWMPHGDV